MVPFYINFSALSEKKVVPQAGWQSVHAKISILRLHYQHCILSLKLWLLIFNQSIKQTCDFTPGTNINWLLLSIWLIYKFLVGPFPLPEPRQNIAALCLNRISTLYKEKEKQNVYRKMSKEKCDGKKGTYNVLGGKKRKRNQKIVSNSAIKFYTKAVYVRI